MNENTVEQPAVKRLERSRSDRMLAGVCGGLARYFDIHPAFYRVGFVVLTLIGGAGVIIYLAAALVIPDEGEEDSIAATVLRERRDRPGPLVALGLVAVAGLVLLSRVRLWPHGDAAWILLLIAGGIALYASHRPRARRTEQPETSEETTEAPLAEAGRPLRRTRRVLRAVGIAIGVLVALLLVATAIFAAVFRVHVNNGIGDQTYHVADARDLRSSYDLGIGDLELDLADLKLPPGETHVKSRVDVGRLLVDVPPGVGLRVNADADLGTVELLGSSSDGREVDKSLDRPATRVLVLDAHVGAGSVHVRRAVR